MLVRVSRPGPRGNSLGYFFCPSRASFQCFSQASGASRSQHRLSSFLLTKDGSRGCNAVGCANTNEHRLQKFTFPPNAYRRKTVPWFTSRKSMFHVCLRTSTLNSKETHPGNNFNHHPQSSGSAKSDWMAPLRFFSFRSLLKLFQSLLSAH